jgi:hypothetical protein
MPENAHIWSMGAALMRARAAVSVQHTPKMMRIQLRGDTLKISSDSQSSHPRMSGGFRQSRLVSDGGQWKKPKPMSKHNRARHG